MIIFENEPELREAIRYKCFLLKGQKHLAKLAGVSNSFISQVINGNKSPTQELLELVGYKAIFVKI